MTDWRAVWNAMNSSNLASLIVATIIGVVLATFTQWLIQYRAQRQEKKQLALLLGYEIAQMAQMAIESTKRNGALLEDYRRRINAGERWFMTVNDMDLFRTVYDKPTTNLSLLPSDLIPTISDIYRRVEICNHIKRLMNDVVEKGNGNLSTLLIQPENRLALGEVDRAIAQFIFYSESYYQNLTNLYGVCDKACEGLSKVARKEKFLVPTVQMVSPMENDSIPPNGAMN